MTAQIAKEDLEEMFQQLVHDLVLPLPSLVARAPMTLECIRFGFRRVLALARAKGVWRRVKV
jgi:hypothetical protein